MTFGRLTKIVRLLLVTGLVALFVVALAGTAFAGGEAGAGPVGSDEGVISAGDGGEHQQVREHARNRGEEFRLRVEERLEKELEGDEADEAEGESGDEKQEAVSGPADRIAKLEAEVAKDPQDGKLLWKLALAYRAAGDYEKAISALKQLDKLPHEGAKVAVMLAICLRAKGDPEAGVTELQEMSSTVPGAVYAYRAILKEELGDLEDAVGDMEEAVAVEPGDKGAYEKLGELYEKVGTGGVKVFVKGKKVNFDVEPVVLQDRTIVPVRAIAEALGAEVRWDGETRTVTVVKAGKVVLIPVGSLKASVDGVEVSLDAPAVIIGGRTLIPLRFVSESLGAAVDWFGQGQVVAVN
ncbi:MAG TPA: tetratricopeptide repeat protein [Firmicutes bacterium]|nr:tetratricopeptide repeat protein [Bacillota bacterium]